MKTSIRSLNRRICALVLALWLVLLVLLTWAVAQDFQNQIHSLAQDLASDRVTSHYSSDLSPTLSGYDSYQQIMHLGDPYLWLRTEPLLPVVLPQLPNGYSSDDWFYGRWELLYGFQAATVFFDEAGNPMVKSGNLLTLRYTTEDVEPAPDDPSQGLAYIDLDNVTEGHRFLEGLIWSGPGATSPSGLFSWVIRSTGYFAGAEFIPVTMERRISEDVIPNDQWETVLTQEAPEGVALTTIYAREFGGITFDHKPVSLDGKQYASLVDVALEAGGWVDPEGLLDTTFVVTGKASEQTGAATFRLAIHTKPLSYALWRLLPMYLLGTLLVVLCLGLLLRYIRANLKTPMEHLSRYVDAGQPVVPSSRWQEVWQAEEHLRCAQERIHALQNDNQTLSASLDYARNAEENRRQLVSNITHELKTPLAVIHSYAEGLQAGIAREKEDYYLKTILEESEKMDAMVLEMLDFSRLEAGKVRLSADHFSLLALTREILEKLAPEERRVHAIEFGYCNDCMVTADESRMAQVVTNLLSNALRYTAPGEHIYLYVFSDPELAHFQIANRAAHLSDEALKKIFDTFYQADDSRSDKGTGLGLPIARNIIQLHRGALTARNTWLQGYTYLEFSFELPLH